MQLLERRDLFMRLGLAGIAGGAAFALRNVPVEAEQMPTSSTLNVCDYGAKGDGIANDTAAFQRTFDAARASTWQKTVLIPGASPWYNIDSPRTVYNNTTVLGEGRNSILNYIGASLYPGPGQHGILQSYGAKNISIRELTLQFPNAPSGVVWAGLIHMVKAIGLVVENCHLIGGNGQGIQASDTVNPYIVGNIIENLPDTGIDCSGAVNARVLGNLMDGTADGVAFYAGAGDCVGCTASGNIVRNYKGVAYVVGVNNVVGSGLTRNFAVAGNVALNGLNAGICVGSGAQSGVIGQNVIEGAKWQGLYANQGKGLVAPRNVNIMGNIFRGTIGDGGAGIYLNAESGDLEDFIIVDNFCMDNAMAGIALTAKGRRLANLIITNNACRNNGRGGPGDGIQGYFQTDTNGVPSLAEALIISHNNCSDDQAGHTQRNGISLLTTGVSIIHDSLVEGNVVLGNTNRPIQISASATGVIRTNNVGDV